MSGPDYTLYRFFDARGALLYVGITKRGWSRAEEHAQRKHWWSRVDHAKFEHYRGLDAAHNAEKRAIAKECPEFNRNHVGAEVANAAAAERPDKWHVGSTSGLRIPAGMPNPASTPTLPIWPDAGKLLGYQSKSAAYRAAKGGYMPTVRVSERSWVVPTATLMAMLGFSEESV